ncbi:hypothetical protein N752_27985 [Desulforamulus aquiferis]|nr:hypothetical protein N752_27985 [Desulforamulus aquiferis]
MKNIKESVTNMSELVNTSTNIGNKQTVATKEIQDNLRNLSRTIDELKGLVKIL